MSVEWVGGVAFGIFFVPFLLLVMGWIIGLWRGGNSCPSVVRRDAHWRGWNAAMILACLILRVVVPSVLACCLVTSLTVAVICSSRERHHAALQETRNTMRMERKAEAREQISIQHAVASEWVGGCECPPLYHKTGRRDVGVTSYLSPVI